MLRVGGKSAFGGVGRSAFGRTLMSVKVTLPEAGVPARGTYEQSVHDAVSLTCKTISYERGNPAPFSGLAVCDSVRKPGRQL